MLRRLSLINTNQCALCLLMTTRFSGQRPNNKRYSMSNKKGRVAASKNNIATLKKLNKKNAKEFFDALPPRDKLDVLRVLHLKRTSRHAGHQSSKLPRYRSALFERWYIFKEEDVREESTLGRGPGGQATNRRMQTVILKHVPSDIIVKFSRFPSLHLNRRAARDLLNERLEEHLLGVDSVLGRRKMLRERRARRRKKVVEYLAKKGGKLNCHCLLKDVYDFHNGQGYLPPSVLREMGYDEGSRVDIKHLFECECKNIWPIIQSCYRTHPQSPELMCYLLPLPQEGDYANFEKCKTDKVLRQNVEKFLFILIEIFGLCLKEKKTEKGTLYAVGKDGIIWDEYKTRLVDDNNALTPLACAVWTHAIKSVTALELNQSKKLLYRFFKRNREEQWSEEALCIFQPTEVKAS